MDVLSLVVNLVAVAASTAGLLVAVDQVTLHSRTRRKAVFLSATIQAEAEIDPAQRAVLVSLYRTTLAKFVAQDAVGGFALGLHLVMTAMGLILTIWSGWAFGTILPTTTAPPWNPGTLALVPILGCLSIVALELGIGWLVLVARRRAEMERSYLAGDTPLEHRIGSRKRALIVAAPLSVGVILIAFTVGWVQAQSPSEALPSYGPIWAALTVLSGVLMAAGRILVTRFVTLDGAIQWRHPEANHENPRNDRARQNRSIADGECEPAERC